MNDQQLIERFLKTGDSRAFEEIVRRYTGSVFSKVITVVKDEDTAKDLVQQTFIKAYERLDCWKGGSLGAWLHTIAVHLALNMADKTRRHPTVTLSGKEETTAADGYSEEHEARLKQMEHAIGQLPERDRQIITLFYYKEKKADEIGKMLGMTTSNVLVKLHRIREQLKKQMEHGNNE